MRISYKACAFLWSISLTLSILSLGAMVYFLTYLSFFPALVSWLLALVGLIITTLLGDLRCRRRIR